MLESVTINLWECLTRLAAKHVPSEDPECDFGREKDAADMVSVCGKWGGFGSELSLTVDQTGTWRVCVFSHESSNQEVELLVTKFGHVWVNLRRETDGILDVRNVSF